jgi:hypothetical protein
MAGLYARGATGLEESPQAFVLERLNHAILYRVARHATSDPAFLGLPTPAVGRVILPQVNGGLK